jgi:hypothetical protein
LLPGQFRDALRVYMEMVKSKKGDVSDMTLAVLHPQPGTEPRREIGTYSSVATLARGIERYGERMMHEDYVIPAQKLMRQGPKANK